MTQSRDEYHSFGRNASKAFVYPQRMQRLLINDYASRAGLRVTLFHAEQPRAGTFCNLEHLLVMAPPLRGLVMFSLEQMQPLAAAEPVLRKALGLGYEIHFALEEMVVRSEADLVPLRFIESVKRIAGDNEATIDRFIEACVPAAGLR